MSSKRPDRATPLRSASAAPSASKGSSGAGLSLDDLQAQFAESAKRRKDIAASVSRASVDDKAAVIDALVARLHSWFRSLSTLDDAPTGNGSLARPALELELSLGTGDGSSFRSGVRRADFDAYRSWMIGQGDAFALESSDETDYIFDPSSDVELAAARRASDCQVRVVFDETRRCVARKEVKCKFADQRHTTETPWKYDVRLTLATEAQFPRDDVPELVPDGCRVARRKRRDSFRPTRGGSWRVDFTEVFTRTPSDASSVAAGASAAAPTFEIEFEFGTDAVRSFADRATLHTALTALFAFVERLLTASAPVEHSLPDAARFADVPMERVADDAELAELRSSLSLWIPSWTATDRFPGPMPIALSRRHFDLIRTESYMLSEKTDGVRYMLLANHNGVYLVDRQFDVTLPRARPRARAPPPPPACSRASLCTRASQFFYLQDSSALGELLAPAELTVLDGELVRHLTSRAPQFMIFDAVVVNGQPLATCSLPVRLDAIGKQIVLPWRVAADAGALGGCPLVLIGKSFVDKQQAGALFDKNIKEIAQGKRVYVDSRRHHATDGLILTPTQQPYRPAASHPIFKWKYLDHLTVDLKLKYNASKAQWTLHAQQHGADVELRALELSAADLARLSAELRISGTNEPILEMVYVREKGIWSYLGVRADKLRPNALAVVWDTMEVLCEAIGWEEVVTLCGGVVKKRAEKVDGEKRKEGAKREVEEQKKESER